METATRLYLAAPKENKKHQNVDCDRAIDFLMQMSTNAIRLIIHQRSVSCQWKIITTIIQQQYLMNIASRLPPPLSGSCHLWSATDPLTTLHTMTSSRVRNYAFDLPLTA